MEFQSADLSPVVDRRSDHLISDCVFLLVAREKQLLASPLILHQLANSCLSHLNDQNGPPDLFETIERGPIAERELYMIRRNTRAARGAASII